MSSTFTSKIPEATDLTFVDLPGLIQNASESEIGLAQGLVKKNIEGDKTLILITIPMSDEMENQEAVRLAKQADPSGIRTIGVLTKPDTITSGAIGSRQRWKEVLQGKIYPLHHGYYCVRLADDSERSRRPSRADSEVLSAEFFAKNEPWNNFVDRSRFGVPNFVKDISQLLLGLIETNLPNLKTAVDQLILECSNELKAMPIAPTREPSTEILLRISDFCRELREAVMGKDHKFLVHNNRRLYEAFKSAIERTQPNFWPFSSKEDYRNPGLHTQGGNVGPYDLEDVRDEIAEALTWELPGIIPYDAIKNIVLKSTSTWRAPTVECFESVFQSTSSTVEKLVARHFKQFTKLETLIKTLSHSELDVCKAEALSLLEKLLRHESVPLYTQNVIYLAEQESKWLREYTKIHLRSSQYYLIPGPPSPPQWTQSTPLPPSQWPQPAPSPPLPSTSYDDELSVMATVTAYFEVASKRFVDHIPLAIEHELNQTFSEKIQQTLIEDIMSGPDVAGKMEDLLSEDEAIASRRQFLEQRLERLKEIKEKLYQFDLAV
ncbi:hypothetical protein BT96DRAFT_675521 [Gymnopus androsaceus JB14]|uniref:GED domain-containing protein n=1 Tax=Gymnopus androsaceus JB14 TaxID=1447944 RepID=A0A6A4HT28_9AGAR|nr:hypothetical protein BT96DRAFT_675521 [Gymnopus androsaceus JB14]